MLGRLYKNKKLILIATLMLISPFSMAKASIETFDEEAYERELEEAASQTLQKEVVPFTNKQLAEIYYAEALKLLDKGEDVKAAEVFLKILEKYPAHVEARLKLIEVYRIIGWVNEAESILEEGLRRDKENTRFLMHNASMLLEQHNPEKALSLLLKVKDQDKKQSDYKAVLAMTYHDLKLYDLAKKNYSALVRQDMQNTKWWLGLAVTMDAQGDQNGALKSFKRVKDLGGANAEVLRYVQGRISALTKPE